MQSVNIPEYNDLVRLSDSTLSKMMDKLQFSDEFASIISSLFPSFTDNEDELSQMGFRSTGYWLKLTSSIYCAVSNMHSHQSGNASSSFKRYRGNENVVSLGMSIESLMISFKILDTIEDDEEENLPFNRSVALNAATGFLLLSQLFLETFTLTCRSFHTVQKAYRNFHQNLLRVTNAQHQDIVSSLESQEIESLYFEIASGKSAELVSAVCSMAASLATNRQEIVDLFAEFGYQLGLARQFYDDYVDAQALLDKNDFQKQKLSLPYVFCYQIPEYKSNLRNLLKRYTREKTSIKIYSEIIRILQSSGALDYTWFQWQMAGINAANTLKKIEAQCGPIEYLHTLVAHFEITPGELEAVRKNPA